jgi:hypothetical protein
MEWVKEEKEIKIEGKKKCWLEKKIKRMGFKVDLWERKKERRK